MRFNFKFLAVALCFNLSVYAADKQKIETSTNYSEANYQTEKFILPDETSQWRQATLDFMNPVLLTEEIRKSFLELLDMTMPSTGITGEELHKERREININKAFNTLYFQDNNQEQLVYINNLVERHKLYFQRGK